MRLQVHVVPAHAVASAAPLCTFLEVASESLSLDDLTISISNRYSRLYPHRPPLHIDKLQDSNGNDLDLCYNVADVFSDKANDNLNSIVRVVQASTLRESSIPPESGLRPRLSARRKRALEDVREGSNESATFPNPRKPQPSKRQKTDDFIVLDSMDERDATEDEAPRVARWDNHTADSPVGDSAESFKDAPAANGDTSSRISPSLGHHTPTPSPTLPPLIPESPEVHVTRITKLSSAVGLHFDIKEEDAISSPFVTSPRMNGKSRRRSRTPRRQNVYSVPVSSDDENQAITSSKRSRRSKSVVSETASEEADDESSQLAQARKEQKEQEDREREELVREAEKKRYETEQSESEAQAMREQREAREREAREVRERAARAAEERVEKERLNLEREKLAMEKLALEEAERKRAAKEKAAKEKLELEEAERKKAAQEELAREEAEKQKAAEEAAAQEKATQEKAAQDEARKDDSSETPEATQKAGDKAEPKKLNLRKTKAELKAEREAKAREAKEAKEAKLKAEREAKAKEAKEKKELERKERLEKQQAEREEKKKKQQEEKERKALERKEKAQQEKEEREKKARESKERGAKDSQEKEQPSSSTEQLPAVPSSALKRSSVSGSAAKKPSRVSFADHLNSSAPPVPSSTPVVRPTKQTPIYPPGYVPAGPPSSAAPDWVNIPAKRTNPMPPPPTTNGVKPASETEPPAEQAKGTTEPGAKKRPKAGKASSPVDKVAEKTMNGKTPIPLPKPRTAKKPVVSKPVAEPEPTSDSESGSSYSGSESGSGSGSESESESEADSVKKARPTPKATTKKPTPPPPPQDVEMIDVPSVTKTPKEKLPPPPKQTKVKAKTAVTRYEVSSDSGSEGDEEIQSSLPPTSAQQHFSPSDSGSGADTNTDTASESESEVEPEKPTSTIQAATNAIKSMFQSRLTSSQPPSQPSSVNGGQRYKSLVDMEMGPIPDVRDIHHASRATAGKRAHPQKKEEMREEEDSGSDDDSDDDSSDESETEEKPEAEDALAGRRASAPKKSGGFGFKV